MLIKQAIWHAGILGLLAGSVLAEEGATSESAKKANLREATEHVLQLEMQLADDKTSVALIENPLLTFGDSARANENGSLWAFGASGRPLAFVEVYRPSGDDRSWVHAITLTSTQLVTVKTPASAQWMPAKSQIDPQSIPKADKPSQRETIRTRQLKELARRFAAHEFWDPDNSRFELRLLVQPVHRYSDASAKIHDGAVFVLAHGTNPEAVLLIEAIGDTLATAHWQYSLARLGSAELHVQFDEEEIWTQQRTPGVVGKPTDPYWLFLTPAARQP